MTDAVGNRFAELLADHKRFTTLESDSYMAFRHYKSLFYFSRVSPSRKRVLGALMKFYNILDLTEETLDDMDPKREEIWSRLQAVNDALQAERITELQALGYSEEEAAIFNLWMEPLELKLL